jgi:hypothetical protein
MSVEGAVAGEAGSAQWKIVGSAANVADADSETDRVVGRYTVHCENVGSMDSDEVVQVYFSRKGARPSSFPGPTPKMQLIDFERVHASAGSAVDVSFVVTESQPVAAFPSFVGPVLLLGLGLCTQCQRLLRSVLVAAPRSELMLVDTGSGHARMLTTSKIS